MSRWKKNSPGCSECITPPNEPCSEFETSYEDPFNEENPGWEFWEEYPWHGEINDGKLWLFDREAPLTEAYYSAARFRRFRQYELVTSNLFENAYKIQLKCLVKGVIGAPSWALTIGIGKLTSEEIWNVRCIVDRHTSSTGEIHHNLKMLLSWNQSDPWLPQVSFPYKTDPYETIQVGLEMRFFRSSGSPYIGTDEIHVQMIYNNQLVGDVHKVLWARRPDEAPEEHCYGFHGFARERVSVFNSNVPPQAWADRYQFLITNNGKRV